ncbi:MAG TPA: fimbrillin family protein [Bacteroides mediterraneensis]|uniref:fimbrillin family protein n=1 Tax=Bacteroides mediterraneensis TaxID=1841856 RepID=UPI0026023B21|nr:fimbrillin family protein [Bacteroides mediterraneensis]HJH65860.1 fimbrillin family protein [Bacteroides mediterraneensis]
MEKEKFVGACLVLSMLASCQQKESLQHLSEEPVLHLKASVYAPEKASRTITDESGGTVFSEKDELGFFMPEENEPVKWTLTGSQWEAESTLVWKDKVSSFSFCAYYPYSEEATTRTSVPMPDLSQQSGTLSGIGDFDFLVARCQKSYGETENGTVSFTGPASFQHVYSLISIKIKNALPAGEVLLKRVSFQGDNLFGCSTYHFGELEEEDGVSYVDASKADVLTFNFEEPVSVTEASGYTLYFLCNPSDLVEDTEFSILYQRDGLSYTASTNKLGKQFSAGKFYQFTLKLTKEELVLEGGEVVDWISEELPEITMDENQE